MATHESAKDQEQSKNSSPADLTLEAHRFSNEAFSVAKDFVAGGDAVTGAKERAKDYQTRLPALSARLAELPPAARADINRVLSDARLDLSYVLSDGKLPSSTRLHFHLAEMGRR